MPPIVHEVLRSSGQPLDAATRAFFEPRFGHDFSHVRVHTDARAAESARTVNALAYTVGSNIVFASGRFTPLSCSGRELLAHELTHVLQQEAGAVSQSGRAKKQSVHPEQEAQRNARQLNSGNRMTVGQSAGPGTLQRQGQNIGTRRDAGYRLRLDPHLLELAGSILRGEHKVSAEVGLSEPLNLLGLNLPGIPPSQLTAAIRYQNDCNRAFQQAFVELEQSQRRGGPVVDFDRNPWSVRTNVAFRSGTVRFNPDLTVGFQGSKFDSLLFALTIATGVSAKIPDACREEPSKTSLPPCQLLRRPDGTFINWVDYLIRTAVPTDPLAKYKLFRAESDLRRHISSTCESRKPPGDGPGTKPPTSQPEPPPPGRKPPAKPPTAAQPELSPLTLYFFYDSPIRRPESNTAFEILLTGLRSFPSLRVHLIGHTSLEGTDEYNLRLSKRRAEATRDALTAAGIASNRIRLSWLGETAPAVPEPPIKEHVPLPSVESVRSMNRRVEAILFDPTGESGFTTPLRLPEPTLRLPSRGVQELRFQ